MSKFLRFGEKLAATVATAATFCSNTVATLLPQGSNTGSNTICTLHWLVSRLKMPFKSLVSSNGSNTFPNSSQEQRFPDSWELGDDYDEDDFEEWYGEEADEWDWDYEPDGSMSWHKHAVDEAIDDEEPGEYPPGVPL